MNAATPSRGEAAAEARELAGLLPESGEDEWELPPGRHLHHKDALMQQIDHDTAPDSTPGSAPASPRRRLLRPAVLMPAAGALAVAGILAATLPSGGTGGVRDMGAGRGATPAATVTLDRIATASLKSGTKPVKDSQFVYLRSLVQSNDGELDGPVKLGPLYKEEIWLSQNPEPVTDIGMTRTSGKGAPMAGQDVPIEASAVDGSDDSGAIPEGPDRPTYDWLATLPTDPDALLKKLYAETDVTGERETKAQAVFDRIGDLVGGSVMPPENAAALYKAVAKLPGVVVVPDAVDAAGRHGIGITIEESAFATRSEWIFDKKTFTYLGSRGYMTKNHKPGGKPGKAGNPEVVYGSSAVLERDVVDQRGLRPAKSAGGRG
ncbi:CU044_5270 family protein [Streptomyces sp. NBC_01283]|uniref:CU044_5270 family protein n=1 Tax=Streptomyces sp. NBC_01283 TaxID=2903812 RepID=UPI00352DC4E7|nr:CU044_5270 family protein [Streptomyces sp. NBC_01283]